MSGGGARVERQEGGKGEEEEKELDTCHDCIDLLCFRTHPRYGVGVGLAHKVRISSGTAFIGEVAFSLGVGVGLFNYMFRYMSNYRLLDRGWGYLACEWV